jgi:hypothetical protein
VHPLLALVIAMIVASLILGTHTAAAALRDVPEAYEDDEGFWRSDGDTPENSEPVRVRIPVHDRAGE